MSLSKPLPTSLQASLEQRAARFETQMSREAAQYLTARGIRRDTAERFRLGFVSEPWSTDPDEHKYVGRLSIPAIGPRGNVYGIKYRALSDDLKPKYVNQSGLPTRPFNLRAVVEAGSTIVVCEGELDAITLEQCGLSAVGIPGVENWKPEWSRMFVGFAEVVVVGDCDEKEQGAKFSAKVAKDVYASRRVVLSEPGDDMNSLYLKGGEKLIYETLGLEMTSV